tara:strand:+ start:412 stop:690 length:279 start_codon:yes stop_codon:yes gene_type:complete
MSRYNDSILIDWHGIPLRLDCDIFSDLTFDIGVINTLENGTDCDELSIMMLSERGEAEIYQAARDKIDELAAELELIEPDNDYKELDFEVYR